MTHDVVMPQLGLTMTEGSVSVWLKQPGDRIEKGEPLFMVETDKVEMEVEATVSGYVAMMLTEPKQVVAVGTPIIVIVDHEEEILTVESRRGGVAAMAATSAQDVESAVIVVPVDVPPEAPSPGEYPASPLAKKLARELGVDLRGLVPAKGKRISAEDVQCAHAAAAAPTGLTAAVVSPGRQAIAERMTTSWQSAPHFYLGVDVDASQLVEFRARFLREPDKEGVKITYNDFFIKAMARAMGEQPAVNSYWQDGGVTARQGIAIGFAAQTDNLLLVPVIRHADRLTLLEIARERSSLTAKAHAGKLTLAEMEGGSATLSNLGQFGIDWFQAILNPPQSVVLAAGRIAKRAVVAGDSIIAQDTLKVTLSADHRVLDGAAAARFLGRIKELLEDPAKFLP